MRSAYENAGRKEEYKRRVGGERSKRAENDQDGGKMRVKGISRCVEIVGVAVTVVAIVVNCPPAYHSLVLALPSPGATALAPNM